MDYQGMLEDLRAMRNRMRYNADQLYSSLWQDEAEVYGEILDFIRYIKELLTSEESYIRDRRELDMVYHQRSI